MVRLLSAAALAGILLGTPLAGVGRLQAQAAAGPTGPAAVASLNSLLPGDMIRTQVWREPDLSGEFQVDEDGTVVLPLLGRTPVSGVPEDKLREQLQDAYGKLLVNPAVNVTLLRRVNVLGEVRVPGQYTVDATNSVADLIARAQGVTADGNSEDIVLVRGGQRLRAGLAGTQSLSEAGIRSGDQIMVGKRGWMSRNFSSMASVLSVAASIIVLVFK
jgi:protein involved in polysaccharide export with SLBB domain